MKIVNITNETDKHEATVTLDHSELVYICHLISEHRQTHDISTSGR